jgi:hypothetical protein
MSGNMVPLAIIVSRSEAVVMASMLEAAGIIVNVGGPHHASVSINSLALGHYRLSVPDWQHDDASHIVGTTFASAEYRFSEGAQTAVIRLLLVKFFVDFGAVLLAALMPGPVALWSFGLPFLLVVGTPVSPQGRSDYFLSERQRNAAS